MQSTSFLGASPSCCHPVPNFLFLNPRFKPKPVILSLAKAQTFSTETCFVPLISRNSCSEEREDKSKYHDRTFFRKSCSPIQRSESRGQSEDIQNQEQDQDPRQGPGATRKARKRNRGIFTSMWWADLKAAFGQRINFEGIICSAAVLARDRHLLLPHIRAPDIRYIDWAELKRRGFEGVVFDKDNTITAPYSLKLWGPTASSVERCKSIFGHNIAVFSNSAGLLEYDHNGSKAKALEWAIGIKVIRHRVKKPAGMAEEIENHFGCDSSRLIMVGDRPFTDIVYGNRNGFLTILTQPLNLTEEPFIVRQVRKLETVLVDSWLRRGLKPTCHRLLSDGIQCVKDPSSV